MAYAKTGFLLKLALCDAAIFIQTDNITGPLKKR